nr:MAG TPA: hypothetical protein [Caudoviricetes sp.]
MISVTPSYASDCIKCMSLQSTRSVFTKRDAGHMTNFTRSISSPNPTLLNTGCSLNVS